MYESELGYDRYRGMKVFGQAILRGTNQIVTWFVSPEHGLLPALETEHGLQPLDRTIQWNERDFYAFCPAQK